jgi:periplasmic copper chaperone A
MKRMSLHRRLLGAALATSLCAAFSPAGACEFYAEHFQIVHPTAKPASSSESGVAIFMEFIQVEAADRLVGASTSVANRVEVRKLTEAGIELKPGSDLTLDATTGHLVLHDLTTQLHEGRQYPLTLIFEKAGAVDVEFIVGDH